MTPKFFDCPCSKASSFPSFRFRIILSFLILFHRARLSSCWVIPTSKMSTNPITRISTKNNISTRSTKIRSNVDNKDDIVSFDRVVNPTHDNMNDMLLRDISEKKENMYSNQLNKNLNWISLSFFLLGGILYILNASWDYALATNQLESSNSVCSTIRGISTICSSTSLHLLIAFSSGFCYFMTGIVDISAAKLTPSIILKDKQQYDSNLLLDTMKLDNLLDMSIHDASNINNYAKNDILLTLLNSKHAYSQEELVGILLASGGFMECVATLLETQYETTASLSFLISCTFYFLEASIAIFGISSYPTHSHASINHGMLKNDNVLLYLDKSGKMLFFTGSVIDLTCSIFWLFRDDIQLYSWSVFSAVLWTIDALLYTMSAIINERIQNKNYP